MEFKWLKRREKMAKRGLLDFHGSDGYAGGRNFMALLQSQPQHRIQKNTFLLKYHCVQISPGKQ